MADIEFPSARAAALDRFWRSQRIYFPGHRRCENENLIRYPDFYVIGAQKAGTTWLTNQLFYHPQVWVPIVKEICSFDEFYLHPNAEWPFQTRLSQFTETIKNTNLSLWDADYISFAETF